MNVRMGQNARKIAELQIDRKTGDKTILDMVEKLT